MITQLKVGKTSFATQVPNNLLLATEVGYKLIPELHVVDIVTWSDFKAIIRELKKEEVKEKFKTITIDTVSILWDLCEKFICNRHGVKELSDVPWGKAYKEASQEFDSALRDISMLGYGIIFLGHSQVRLQELSENNTIEIFSPDLNKRAASVVNRMVDLIGFIKIERSEEGEVKRFLYTRETPTIMAGSRFKYLPMKLDFNYDSIVDAMTQGIEYAAEREGVTPVDEKTPVKKVINDRSFEEVQKEAEQLWKELVSKDARNAQTILENLDKVFGGTKKKLSEVTAEQKDLLELVVLEMRALAGKQ